MRRFPVTLYTLLAFFACCGVDATAYVLPAPHILELVVQNGGRAKTLKVIQHVAVYPEREQDAAIPLAETLRYRFPDRFRADIEAEHLRRIHMLSGESVLTVLDGHIAGGDENWFDHYKDILLFRSRQTLMNGLIRRGIDTRISSLGRLDGRIAFVIGARYPETAVPQLWVDKDTFRPIRWILSRNGAGLPDDFLDVRFDEWKMTRGFWYPMHIAFYQDQRLLRDIRVEDVVVDPGFDESLFDVEKVRIAHRGPAVPAAEGGGDKEIGDVQKVIDDFSKIYR